MLVSLVGLGLFASRKGFVKPEFIDWLQGASMSSEQESKEAGLTYLANRSMSVNAEFLPWKSPVIVQRECYLKFLQFLGKWKMDKGERRVVSGTPGIGKTTLIYYLIWLFLAGKLDYEWIVFCTAERLIAIAKGGKCNPHRTGDEPMLAKSLGLFDIKPDATVAEGQKSLNTQNANRHFRVCHMVIVATVGFRGVLGEFWKTPKSVKYFPTWSPTSSIGLSKLMGLSDSDGKERIEVCGDCIPRLVHSEFGLEDLKNQVDRFCKAVFGALNVAEKRTSVKEAHTMLVLQPSPDMKERDCPSFVPLLTADTDDGSAEAKEGETIGLVSTYVRDALLESITSCTSDENLNNLVQRMPEIVRYYFQDGVLNAIGRGDATLHYKDAPKIVLQFKKLEFCTGAKICPKPSVLYRHPPQQERMRSIDAFGCCGDTLYLLQPTTGQRHAKVRTSHIKELIDFDNLPDAIQKVVALYIRPCHCGEPLRLVEPCEGKDSPEQQISKKAFSSVIVASLCFTRSCSKHIQKAMCQKSTERHS